MASVRLREACAKGKSQSNGGLNMGDIVAELQRLGGDVAQMKGLGRAELNKYCMSIIGGLAAPTGASDSKERQMRQAKERQMRQAKEREMRQAAKEREMRQTKERQMRQAKERQLRQAKERQLRQAKERQLRQAKERQLRQAKEHQMGQTDDTKTSCDEPRCGITGQRKAGKGPINCDHVEIPDATPCQGPWKISGPIGQGNNSETYTIKNAAGKEYVLKIIRVAEDEDDYPEDLDPDDQGYIPATANDIETEIELQQQAVNEDLAPDIVQITRSPTEYSILMEKIDGPTLEELLKRDPRNKDKYINEVKSAIRELTKSGIFHGDLHPGNIIRGPKGWMFIDFGSAKECDGTDYDVDMSIAQLDFSLAMA